MQIKNKVAIVTGASGGIGMAAAKVLTKRGAKVALIARSREKLEEVAKELKDAFVVVCDMSKPNEVKKMVDKVYKHFGRIDILINNAGQGYDAPICDIKINTLQYIFDLSVIGPLVAMQEVIPIMKKQKKGAIVTISSGTSLMNLPNMGGYSSLKRALNGISLTAREEFKKDKIEVSIVYPYITDTDFEKNTIKHGQELDWGGDGHSIPPGDSPQFVARKILEAIKTGKAEIYAHDWMNPKNRGK